MYDIPYIDEIKSIDDYINAVKLSLEYWINVHTDPETWANEWCMDNVIWAFNESPIISNNYFSFNWKDAVYHQLAKEWQGCFCKCSECGIIDEYLYCNCEDADQEIATENEIYEWVVDCGIELNQLNESTILNALIEQGFPVYQEALDSTISGIVEEVKEILQSFDNAESNNDLLVAALWGTRVWHVNGNIFDDYSERLGLDYHLIDNIRNDGISSVFSKEEIKEFIES